MHLEKYVDDLHEKIRNLETRVELQANTSDTLLLQKRMLGAELEGWMKENKKLKKAAESDNVELQAYATLTDEQDKELVELRKLEKVAKHHAVCDRDYDPCSCGFCDIISTLRKVRDDS